MQTESGWNLVEKYLNNPIKTLSGRHLIPIEASAKWRVVVQAAATVGACVTWRRADDRTLRVEDREGIGRVVLVELFVYHLFCDFDLLGLATNDAQGIGVCVASVFFVDVDISTGCLL